MVTPQADKTFEPAEEYVIRDLDTLKVLADPLRLRILEMMSKPQTVKKIAAELDLPATKLYYHINLLEKHGLIVLVDTRVVSGIIEKHYRVVADKFRVDRSLLSPGGGAEGEGITITLNGVFDSTREDVIRSLRDGVIDLEEEAPKHRSISMGQYRFALTEEQAEDFFQRFEDMLEGFNEDYDHENIDLEGTTIYKMLYILWPSSSKPGWAEQDDEDA